ncbi:hypothetical protein [Cylindrospermopsis raciborskii]|uniref:hypothetical protein n=1 Tax=Cylindrospermopsis raciborskii TaxID=77022 RepID=UPI0015879199|nr:hypothetical protein [Cylindrospermopsis raciborskii]
MTNIDSLLSSYQALSEEHAKQTEHQFVTIRQILDERVKEIYDSVRSFTRGPVCRVK